MFPAQSVPIRLNVYGLIEFSIIWVANISSAFISISLKVVHSLKICGSIILNVSFNVFFSAIQLRFLGCAKSIRIVVSSYY